ncbi:MULTISPECIES: biopolymer transporter ExbD [unclassified Variovorax]|jgi:biopolymer transport protein ExbD|uniref:ExbD/TolR family protein n=1 Tax=Variovorax TaxID=34072 RepID=UPI0008F3340B|nr:biopolymer transporter ExbD [Variovorax sp. PDC80]SFO37488.1 biopolymer transport protein ExbD [Variovorax sp. PDC80]
MQFRHGARDEPEINLIPFIDVLLVVLIFLMLSTTYSKFTEMQLRLPTADVDAQRDYPKEVIVGVSADGRYSINKTPMPDRSVDTVAAALAAAATGGKDSVVIISADASSPHQAVVTVMEAARRAGLMQITFAAQSTAQAGH